ncbi:hypothetical protein MBLNU459_g5022t2 [Dothideomycetes sp. NU459]
MAIGKESLVRDQIVGRADVLIIGAGPAGCMAGSTLARYGVDFRIFDKNPTRTQTGHASAFQPRTQEILQTIGLLQKLDNLGHRLTETAFWRPNPAGDLERVSMGPEVVHHQGLTEQTFEDDIVARGHKIDRFMEFIGYESSTNSDSEWPLKVYVKNGISGTIDVWFTKYVLGTDGARSMTRRSIGAQTISNDGQDTWAVADVLLDTDFPDRRRRCAIRTPSGSCMLIPRKDEGMRIFLQLDEDEVARLDACSSTAKNAVLNPHTAESAQLLQIVQSRARKVLNPYTINFTQVIWISRYHVAQRIVDRFSDKTKRVFLLGDACHSHSPKAGQGMNVSISDAYNLTWKLAMVLKGAAHTKLLDSYEHERRFIAQQLIDFDTKFARLFGQKDDLDSTDLHDLWEQGHGFASGCAYRYPEGLLVDDACQADIDPSALEPVTPGKRLLNLSLIRHIDGTKTDLLFDMPSNGRFHLMVFAGNLLGSDRFATLAQDLCSSSSVLEQFNPLADSRFRHEDITTSIPSSNKRLIIDTFLFHTLDHFSIELDSLPSPFGSMWQTRVYEDKTGIGHHQLGIDKNKGCVVLVRPDGYIGKITSFEDIGQINLFLANFLSVRS